MNKNFSVQIILISLIIITCGLIGVLAINNSKKSEIKKMLIKKMGECSGYYYSEDYKNSSLCYYNLIIAYNKEDYFLNHEQEILLSYVKSLYGNRDYLRAKTILDEAQEKKFKKTDKKKDIEFLELEKIIDKKVAIIKNSKKTSSANLNFNFEEPIFSPDKNDKKKKAQKEKIKKEIYSGTTSFHDLFRRCLENLNDSQCGAASECFGKLTNIYSSKPEFKKIETVIRTGYGESLICSEDYELAKKQFEFVVANEYNDTQMIASAEQNLKYIDQELKKIQDKKYSQNNDRGNYLDGTEIGWKDPTKLTVYIENSPYQDFAKNAFKMWDEALGMTVSFKFVHTPSADIVLKFTTKNLQIESNHAAGLAHMRYKGKNIIHSDIDIGLINPKTNKYHTKKEIYNITLHEIGHALGAHHSDRKNDIMYPTTDTYRDVDLSNRDVNTIRTLYEG